MLAAQIRRLHSYLMLHQNPNDLLIRVPVLLHPSHPTQIKGERQLSVVEFSGAGQQRVTIHTFLTSLKQKNDVHSPESYLSIVAKVTKVAVSISQA
jgi:hypothetical protein